MERREVLFTTRDRKFTLHAYPSIIPPLVRLLDMLYIFLCFLWPSGMRTHLSQTRRMEIGFPFPGTRRLAPPLTERREWGSLVTSSSSFRKFHKKRGHNIYGDREKPTSPESNPWKWLLLKTSDTTVNHSLIHSFRNSLLRISHMPGTVLNGPQLLSHSIFINDIC